MGERNSVAVKIYGQEYSIVSEMPREYIMRVADYIDGKMKEIGAYYNGSASGVAVLAAATITDELFRSGDCSAQLETANKQLEEARHYNEVLRGRIEELNQQLESSRTVPEETQKLISELEAKCRDIESSFFDIQMENIHLKNELESLRKQDQPFGNR